MRDANAERMRDVRALNTDMKMGTPRCQRQDNEGCARTTKTYIATRTVDSDCIQEHRQKQREHGDDKTGDQGGTYATRFVTRHRATAASMCGRVSGNDDER